MFKRGYDFHQVEDTSTLDLDGVSALIQKTLGSGLFF